MKVSVTINIGNYENVSIESSEYPDVVECINEIKDAERHFRVPAIAEYIQKVFGGGRQ
ncbi:MAG: hypothetical protein J7K40_12160 [candidate division Zixibacteria bacterium]|nr:hypothetical protein [candidate division Zixibacteria bacterium]